jgi:arginyl-tRNA synthetase
MLKEQIADVIEQALKAAQVAGDLPAFDLPERIPVENAARPEFGDFASPVALSLAKAAHMSPLKIAEGITTHMGEIDFLTEATVAPPGFINLRLSPVWLAQQVGEILAAGSRFGNVDLAHGKRLQVEFVSSNPNGPLTIGHARNAAIGDTLANVLEAAGYRVQREYYFNDAGLQMELFYASVYARYMQALGNTEVLVPENGYRGAYVVDLAEEIIGEEGDRLAGLPQSEGIRQIGKIALQKMIDRIKEDLALMDVRYDNWYTESSVFTSGLFDRVLDMLRKRGFVEEKDGAVWFTSTGLGEDKDNVIVRSNGHPTYFASDIGYHYDKFVLRGFDEVIDVWGADHQGHVPRMKAVMKAFGLDAARLDIVLYQLVTLTRVGEAVRLSTRTGDIITLREVIEEVGGDVVRFLLLQRSANAQMDFDLEVARDTSDKNPVYYVQYAHARIASILRNASERGLTLADTPDLSLLVHETELNLIRKMLQLPAIIELIATQREPHHLPFYAQELATAFHVFYRECRVVSSVPGDEAVTRARLALVWAAKLVLARTLALCGIHAPERM